MKVKLVGVDRSSEDEYEIAICNHGICIEDDAIVDVATRQQIIVRWVNRDWVTKREDEIFKTGENPFKNIPQFFIRVFAQAHHPETP